MTQRSQWLEREDMVASAGLAVRAWSAYASIYRDALEWWLGAAHIPTESELARLRDRIARLERRVHAGESGNPTPSRRSGRPAAEVQ